MSQDHETPTKDLPAAILSFKLDDHQSQADVKELRPGSLCPQCQARRLDYDGMLNLACPQCGYTVGGCFT